MVVTLIILTVTALIVSISSYAIKNVQQRVDVSIYFNTQTSEDQINQVRSQLESQSQVASVQYISAQDGLNAFKNHHANDQVIIKSLGELSSNPIPATLQVKAKELNQYDSIVQFVSQDQFKSYISKINYDDNRDIIQRLSKILSTLKETGIILAIIFSFIAILVIFNTIRLTIYNRREEVEIMRLVGATDWYIRWPFIIESMMYAVIAVIITSLLLFPALHYIIPAINEYVGADANTAFKFINYWLLFGGELFIALFLGVLSSFVAIRRYLKL